MPLVFILVVRGQAAITLGVCFRGVHLEEALVLCLSQPELALPSSTGSGRASTRALQARSAPAARFFTGLRSPPSSLSECQCLPHPSSPTQQFRVVKIPRQVGGTQRDRTTAVSRSSCPRYSSSRWSFPQCRCRARGWWAFFTATCITPSTFSRCT